MGHSAHNATALFDLDRDRFERVRYGEREHHGESYHGGASR
jgi:hypothetical protein